ncbi:sugar ABC transporter substrate-binding protein [Nakamurella leprariae]|uniref:Sugar ABC transporter substrate-binding protein n=1 Tax=Nakamurella leprariae TaxID=2803911 RepID=A0A938Y585_9ACTN|nr:substrate-binding domain-containing protein [Nakamurella leprariae]MBM9466005.1 sugar ABC transporter substrate-binding protein [Nakamurella leprariae]
MPFPRVGPRRPDPTRPRISNPAPILAGLLAVAVLLVGCSTAGPDVPTTSAAPPETTTSSSDSTTIAPSTTPTPLSPTTLPTTTETGATVPFRTVVPGSGDGLRIGLVAPTTADAFGRAVTDSVVAQAEIAGADLVRCDPGDDAALLLECAQRMATQQVDGWIAIPPPDLGDAFCTAGPQDVPLIAIAPRAVRCQTARIGTDELQAGFLAGSALGRSARLTADCSYDALVLITNSATGSTATRRLAGIRTGFASECPGPLDDAVQVDAATQDIAYRGFTAALTGVPADGRVLVAAVDDVGALGVAAALDDTDTRTVTLAAVGADQQARCRILDTPQWLGDTALFPDRYGEVAVPALLDALAGKALPRIISLETTFVTAETVGDVYDLDDCPAQ